MKNITVDFSRQQGRIKPMHGVNNGPLPKGAFRGLDNFDSFKDAGFPVIRNHDASFFSGYGGEHTVDVGSIFPDFDADETDPASYDFVHTDYYMRACADTGAKILYRLGSKIEHEPKKYQSIPPRDYGKWARICEHIIAHLVYGWADGLHLDIPYWEIWNEPDNYDSTGHNPCWQGSYEQYLELYAVAATHLKKCFPELKIGGPALTASYKGNKYFETFIQYVADRGVPLDFYSWHRYNTDPHKYVSDVLQVREALDALGYTETELVIDEWNYVETWVGEAHKRSLHTMMTEKGAAFDAAVMLALQRSPLDLATYYDARPYCEFNGLWQAFTHEPLKGYWVFRQFNSLYRLGTEVFSESDHPDLYVAAAKGAAGMGIQIAHYHKDSLEEDTVRIALKGMEGTNEITCYVVDEDHDHEIIRSDIYTTQEGALYLKMKENAVIYLDVRKISGENADG